MQQPPTNDYINWLRMQDGQLAMEEAQLTAEEQWLQQKLIEHKNNKGQALGQILLYAMVKNYRPTPWRRQSFQLRDKRNELEQRRRALHARRTWLQQEKLKYSLP